MLAFAGDGDPVDVAIHRGRAVAFEQSTLGWSGPPFDPFELAHRLGLKTRPVEGLDDARTISEDGQLVIEFNPQRPRGRLRYSIAHEIAHTFFDDVANEVRHRTGQGAVESAIADDWQLELLCNLAAAELLMPNFSMPFDELDATPINIDRLMTLRARFDVSTEAILRRFVDGTAHHVALVATSRINDSFDADVGYRIDYVTSSRTWTDPPVVRGDVLDWAALRACTAVGYTWHGTESAGAPVEVHAVGTPPYPDRRFPRVIALVQRPGETAEPTARIRYVTGDAAAPPGTESTKIIVQVTNDTARALGGRGFAQRLQRGYTRMAGAYRNWTIAAPDNLALGNVHIVEVESNVVVASIVAQEGFGPSDSPRVRYEPLRAGLITVAAEARRLGATVHMPRIGTGQAGGRWEMIEPIVDETLCRNGVEVTVYDPPQTAAR